MRRHLLTTLLSLIALLGTSGPASAQPRCEAPRVLLSVDRSSSMVERLPDGLTKWDAARLAIEELTRGREGEIEFGVQVFPAADGCGAGQVRVGIGDGDTAAILAALGAPPPEEGHGTPLAETLREAGFYPPLFDLSRSRHVVLITDGAQWNCGGYDEARRFAPLAEVTELRRLGITVHVLGFGAGADALVLNRAAVAAGTARPGCDASLDDPSASGHCYHQADDLSELRLALDEVARSVTEEVCDGFDNDCDGVVDDGFDQDEDSYTVCGTRFDEPGLTDPTLADCDDLDPLVNAAATEICDGIDNDCDGAIDPGCECAIGDSARCGSDVGACVSGRQACVDGAFSATCEGEITPRDEVCNGYDDDCNGVTDDGAECPGDGLCLEGRCVAADDPAPPPPPREDPPAVEEAPPIGRDDAPPAQAGGCSAAGGAPPAAALAMTLFLVATRRPRRAPRSVRANRR